MIKNIKLFVNNNDKSFKMAKLVKNKFLNNGFRIVDKYFDLGIALGGDGSFLGMVKSCDFSDDPYYIGINSGTLGFLQEVKDTEINKLIYELKNDLYKVSDVGIQETKVYHCNGVSKFCSLNEIVIRNQNLKVFKGNIFINSDLLEYFNGDGILVSTTLGSTAHNLSYGGSIVYNNFQTLQITPMGPINSKSYRTLSNSVILPDKVNVFINPMIDKNLIITIDGENNLFDDVSSIDTSIQNKKIKCLRLSHYNFPQKINEKLLSNEK